MLILWNMKYEVLFMSMRAVPAGCIELLKTNDMAVYLLQSLSGPDCWLSVSLNRALT